jgi:hypothetical protein
MPGRDVVRAYLTTGLPLIGAPTLLLYRAEVVRGRDPFFRSPGMHADVDACLEVLADHAYGFVPEILTFSRVREVSLTSAAKDLNVYIPNMLEFQLKFGPIVLSTEQLQRCVRNQLSDYYAYLGREALRGRDPAFWDYHRGRLASLGHPMSRTRLWLSAVLTVLEYLPRRARGPGREPRGGISAT